jgi:hypothetical protein
MGAPDSHEGVASASPPKLGPGAAKLVSAAHFPVVALSLPQQRHDNAHGGAFPLVLGLRDGGDAECTTSAVCAWLSAHRDVVEQALVEHGGLYLRGFPVNDAPAFDALMVSMQRCA